MSEKSPEQAGQIVRTLVQAVTRGGYSLKTVPRLIEEVLRDGLWRKFYVNPSSDKPQTYEYFEQFVEARVPLGLETNMKTLKALCWDEGRPDVADEIDKQITRPSGRPADSPDKPKPPPRPRGRPRKAENVVAAQPEKTENAAETGNNVPNKTDLSPRPEGNTRDKGLRRLRETPAKLREEGKPEEADRIEKLHEDVIQKRKTVHAAMKEAGFRKPTLTVAADNAEAAAQTIYKNYGPEGTKAIIAALVKLVS